MGLFCVNFHFRGTDEAAVSAALRSRRVTQFHVLPARADWTSVYEAHASRQDEQRIRSIATELSRDLQVAGIAFLVHDSDIACYWLFDRGQIVDEFNSCPDYFGDGAPESSPSGGDVDLLLPYCRRGTNREQLAEILGQETVFAEAIIEQLADVLGIEPERALSDFRDISEDSGPGGPAGFGGDAGGSDDGDDDRDDSGADAPNVLPFRTQLSGQLAELFGTGKSAAAADPAAVALVQATVRDDVAEVDRLLKDGVAPDAAAPAPLPSGQSLAGLGQLVASGLPQISMTPLLAAIVHQRRDAALRLLEAGADPNRVHPLFGTPVHAATAAGSTELLQLLLDRGGDVSVRNAQGQTPLQVVTASRASLDRLAQLQAMVNSMGVRIPGVVHQLSKIELPTKGWDACERMLKERGAL